MSEVLEPVRYRIRGLKTLILVSVAVVGLLAMHGFDGAIISLTPPDAASSHHDDAGIHGALGLCLFVLSMAGLGLAAIRAGKKHQGLFAAWPTVVSLVRWSNWWPPAGRSRLLALGVMRH